MSRKIVKAMDSPGWSKPPTARKWHYFLAGDNRSICGGYGFNIDGYREDTNDSHKENCKVCQKKLAPIRAKAEAKS